MKTPASLHVRFINSQIQLGKPEYWIVDALVQHQWLDRDSAQGLVTRIVTELDARWRRKRRMMWIGLFLLILTVPPVYLGIGRRGRPPVFPGFFPEDSLLGLFMLIALGIGAILFLVGGAGRGWRTHPPIQKDVQPLPPGQFPPPFEDGEAGEARDGKK